MKTLGLPYQVINICTGDLGRPAAKNMTLKLGCHRKKNIGKRILLQTAQIFRHAD